MKQLFITLFIGTFILMNVNGQPKSDLVVYKDSNYDMYFLADSLTGECVILLNYDYVGVFREGLSIVKKDGKIGCIDKSGSLVIPLIYDDMEPFENGYAEVKKGSSEFLINKSGATVCDVTKFDLIGDVSDGLFLVSINNKYGFYNVSGKEVVPLKYDYAYPFREGFARIEVGDTFEEYAFIDKSGVIINPENCRALNDFSEGLGAVAVDDKCGYMNSAGTIVIPLLYSSAEPFQNGFAVVSKEIESERRFGLIDKNGKEVIPCDFSDIVQRADGFILVVTGSEGGDDYFGFSEAEDDTKYGLYNASGQQITPVIYDDISMFDGEYAIVTKGFEKKLINKTGKEISGPIKDAIVVNGLAVVQTMEQKMSILNNQGAVICTHDFILSYPDSSFIANDGGILVGENSIHGGKCGLLSTSGMPLTPVQYDYIGISKEGYHLVSRDKKYGFLNRNGKEIVKLDYAIAGDFDNGLALVNDSAYFDENSGWLGGHWGYVNQNGNVVIPLIYDLAGPFSDGLALVEKNNEKFYIDKTGKEVLKLSFDDASGFSHGIAIVLKDDKFGAIDTSGNLVIPLNYDGYIDSLEKWHRFRQGTDILLIDNTGQVLKKL